MPIQFLDGRNCRGCPGCPYCRGRRFFRKGTNADFGKTAKKAEIADTAKPAVITRPPILPFLLKSPRLSCVMIAEIAEIDDITRIAAIVDIADVADIAATVVVA